jgi:hypothetical protein
MTQQIMTCDFYRVEETTQLEGMVAKLRDAYSDAPDRIWLCGVTKFVFDNDYPEAISVKYNC